MGPSLCFDCIIALIWEHRKQRIRPSCLPPTRQLQLGRIWGRMSEAGVAPAQNTRAGRSPMGCKAGQGTGSVQVHGRPLQLG